MTAERQSKLPGVARMLAGYRPPEGVPDELLGPDGTVRPVWGAFIARLAAIGSEEMAARMARGDQYLRDAGVYYRRYDADASASRDWPLSHLPVLLDAAEWDEIATGLSERADLLEAVAADLYGENRLVADGHLPAALIAQNREWLRPLVGVRPASGHFLHFLAFDIGRGPEGKWWVLGDRTQAPSGAGFALENRIATARVYGEIFAQAQVTRLSGFFRAFRDMMMGLRASENSRVGILTPGPMNETYFEHAYIARYLGFMLLEGEDLAVREGQLMVRTVGGLKPISVLWRRLDAAWSDPLELNEGSAIGTPGLVGAVRQGSVSLVNALGSGVLETRALLAFLPRLSQELMGKPLRMPNVATWWCGQDSERAYVRDNADTMTLSAAYSTGLAFENGPVPPNAGTLGDWIDAQAGALVGQEQVQLSTTPAFVDGALKPRPMTLRVYLARTATGWSVMPGGFARIGASDASPHVAMQQGGLVADVWVTGGGQNQNKHAASMLPGQGDRFARNQPGVLPARAADNLFWLGRYIERAEFLLRQLRAYHARLAETADPNSDLLTGLAAYLDRQGADPADCIPEAVIGAMESALRSAGHVRDRFSTDALMALEDLIKTARRFSHRVEAGDDAARAQGVLLRKLSGLTGLIHENMYRATGWRFLSIGRALERASTMCSALLVFADDAAPEGGLDIAIELGDSAMSHHRRYSVATNRATVVDLLALDPLNPRSVKAQLDAVREHIDYLPGNGPGQRPGPLSRAVLRVQTDVALQDSDAVDGAFLSRLDGEIAAMSDALTATYLR